MAASLTPGRVHVLDNDSRRRLPIEGEQAFGGALFEDGEGFGRAGHGGGIPEIGPVRYLLRYLQPIAYPETAGNRQFKACGRLIEGQFLRAGMTLMTLVPIIDVSRAR